MDDGPDGGADLPDGHSAPGSEPEDTESTEPARPTAPIGGLPPDSAAVRELADEAAEIRRMVDAGAGSPEAIRELAERLREHRAREEALWRTEVKPSLVRDGRGRLRTSRKPAEQGQAPGRTASQPMGIGIAILVVVALVILAANTTAWLLVLPVIALLAYAWSQGNDRGDGSA